MLRILIIFLCLTVGFSAYGAKPTGLPKPELRPEVYTLANPVKKAQEMLKQLGFYEGKIDGLSGPDLQRAIRFYQKKHNLKQTGQISDILLSHLENVSRVQTLVTRLDHLRSKRQDEARQALLSDPRTRKLLESDNEGVADPTRDASHCFQNPTSKCLLSEAVASSRAVFEDDLRDWALGEILSAQVETGLNEQALETVSRIKDSRLVIAALANIASTNAKENKFDEAYSTLSLIPVVKRQVAVLLDIAKQHQKNGAMEDMHKVIEQALRETRSIRDLEQRLSLQIQISSYLAEVDHQQAVDLLITMSNQIRRQIFSNAQELLLRQVAQKLAQINEPEQALILLDKLPLEENRTPVQMAVIRSYLKLQRFNDAEHLISTIEADRYKSIILTDYAVAKWKSKDQDKALQLLTEAQNIATAIRLPFARNFALSQIATKLTSFAGAAQNTLYAKQAQSVLNKITDDRLKARGLWDLAHTVDHQKIPGLTNDISDQAQKALDGIKSKFSRAWILGEIAEHYHRTGETMQAQKALELGLKATQNLKNQWARSRALAKFSTVIHRVH